MPDKPSQAMCELVIMLASKKATKRARNGLEVESDLIDLRIANACVNRGLLKTGTHQGKEKIYLPKKGISKVSEWLREGFDGSGRGLTPEERGKLRHLYWKMN